MKVKALTPFHETYLAKTVAQVKTLLWEKFEKEESLKEEPYEYKNEEMLHQERLVVETQSYRDLLTHILSGGKVKFQRELYDKKRIEKENILNLSKYVSDYTDDGESTGKYWDLKEEDKEAHDRLNDSLVTNFRKVLSFVEYPESWEFVYKQSRIGFQEVHSKRQSILKIFNRESIKKKKQEYSTNEGLFKLKITKSGFVRYFNGKCCRWLSLKNWHNTKVPLLDEEILRLLVSINPNNEFLRGETKKFYFIKYDVPNKDLRKSTSWKAFYKSQVGFYREDIPLIIAKDIAAKVREKDKLESFLDRVDGKIFPDPKDNYPLGNDKHYFEQVYHTLLLGSKGAISDLVKINSTIIQDAYSMAQDLDEEFNLKIESAKKFKEYHNDLAKRHRLRQMGPLKPHEKFKVLQSEGKFQVEFIDSSERLLKEATELCHCVTSYAVSINMGRCGIYSIWDGEKRWTLELNQTSLEDPNHIFFRFEGHPPQRIAKRGFFMGQCRGLYNESAPDEVTQFIQGQLDKINKEKK